MENFEDECIFLLGAGASADAGVPVSVELNERIRDKIRDRHGDPDHLYYRVLNYVIGAIHHYYGMNNENPNEKRVDIEQVISAIQLLRDKNSEFLSAFVGSWNDYLQDIDDSRLDTFLQEIKVWTVDSLNQDNPANVEYLNWFGDLHRRYGSKIHVFTLNHDRCVESALQQDKIDVCTGFDYDATDEENLGTWNPQLFDGGVEEAPLNLYKIHGSLGWYRGDEGYEIFSKRYIEVSDPHLVIFGVLDKVTVRDPFFELVKRFKEKAFSAPLIVSIGYGFSDRHINEILFRSLRSESGKKLVIVDKDVGHIQQVLEEKYPSVNVGGLVEFEPAENGAEALLRSGDLEDSIDEWLEEVRDQPF